MFNEKLQVDILRLDDSFAARAMDTYSKFPPLIPVYLKNPRGVLDAVCSAWIGDLGWPKGVQMAEGGQGRNEIRTDLCPERRI